MSPEILKNRQSLAALLAANGYSDVTIDVLNNKFNADEAYSDKLWNTLINDKDVKSKVAALAKSPGDFKTFVYGQPAPSQGGLKKNEATTSQPATQTVATPPVDFGKYKTLDAWGEAYNKAPGNDMIQIGKDGLPLPTGRESAQQNAQQLKNVDWSKTRIATEVDMEATRMFNAGNYATYKEAYAAAEKQNKEWKASQAKTNSQYGMTGNVPEWGASGTPQKQTVTPKPKGFSDAQFKTYSSSRDILLSQFEKTDFYKKTFDAILPQYDNLSYTTGTGERAIDKSMVRDWLKTYLKSIGSKISADDGIGDYLHSKLTAGLEAKGLEIRVETKAKSLYKEKYGTDMEADIKADQSTLFGNTTAPVVTEFQTKAKTLSTNTNTSLQNTTAQYEKDAEQLVKNFEDPVWISENIAFPPIGIDRNKYYQDEFDKRNKALHAAYAKNHSTLSADANRQLAILKNNYTAMLGKKQATLEKSSLGKEMQSRLNTVYAEAGTYAMNDRDVRRQTVLNKQVGDIPVLRQFNILSRSIASGSANFLANAATWVDHNLKYKYSAYFRDQFQDLARNASLPQNAIKSWSDLLDVDKLVQNIGEQSVPVATSIAVSLAVRRPVMIGLTGAGVTGTTATAIGTVSGATAGMISENIQRQGEVIANLQDQGVDPKTALERSKTVWNNPVRDIALNALQLEALFGKLAAGSFVRRFSIGATGETATEIPQEVFQTREEERAMGIPEGQGATVKEIALNVLPTSILMSGGSAALQAQKNSEPLLPTWVSSVASYPINKLTEQITNTNANLVKAAIELSAFNGTIQPEKMEELGQIVDNVQTHVQTAKEAGLNKKQQVAYVSLVANAENISNQITEAKANGATTEQIAKLEQYHTNASNAAKSLLTEKSGNYAVITQEDGDQVIVSHEDLNTLLDNEQFTSEVKSGNTSVELRSNKKATFDVSSLHKKLSAANKRFDQKVAVYENEANVAKALDQKLGINRKTTPHPDSKVGGILGQQVRLQTQVDDITGELHVDGQRLVIENENTIRDIGNINDLRDLKPKELGISLVPSPETAPEFTPKTEEEVNIPGMISLFAGKMNPETLIDTLKMVVPSVDRNILAAQVYSWDNAHRQTNRRVNEARQTDQDKRSPSKIETPTAEVGKEYTGNDVAEVIAEVGDKTTTGAVSKMTQAMGQNFVGQEVNLDEMYEKDEEFARRVEEERQSKKPQVDQSKKTYNSPENTPAIMIGGRVIDGMGRLAQRYLNGDKTASAYVSTGPSQQQMSATPAQAQTQEQAPANMNEVIDRVFAESFGVGSNNAQPLINQARAAQERLREAGVQDAEVVVHENEDEYAMAVGRLGGDPESAGNAAFRTVDGKRQVYRIDINASRANERTVAHELAHAVLINGFGTNEPLFQQFRDQVINVLKSSDAEALNKFADQYGSANAEEFLAELAGALNAGQVDTTVLSRVAQIINNIISRITGGKFIPFQDIQNANEIINMLRALNPTMGFQTISGEESGTRAQGVSLSRGTETLRRFGVKPGKPATTRVVAKALEERQRAKYGTISPDDRSTEAKRKISNWMVEEVKYFMGLMGDQSGKDWYGEKYQKGLNAMAQIFPEMATDQSARDLFTMLVAITSDGQKVLTNFKLASIAYQYYRTTGELPSTLPGQRNFDSNLARINALLNEFNGDVQKAKTKLLEVDSIKNINAKRKDGGLEPITSSWPVEFEAPYAAAEFGPKLGMFYANLSGQENYPTLDRWWSRTFNRYRGALLQDVKKGFNTKGEPIGLDRLKAMLGDPAMTDEQALYEARNLRDSYADKGYKNGTDLEKAGNTTYKNAFENLNDAPFNKKDRQFMYDAVVSAVKKLNNSGNSLTIADVQAILWYFEKNLYKTLGVRANITGISYEEAADITFERWKSANGSFGYDINPSEDVSAVEDADEDIEEESGSRSQVVPTMMVSPNELEGTQFDNSLAMLGTPEMDKVVKAVSAVDKLLGLSASSIDQAVGVWTDGAEQSTISKYENDVSFETLRAAAAVKGLLLNQKSVLAFKPDATIPDLRNIQMGGIPSGFGILYQAPVNMDAKAVTDLLTSSGIEYKTVVPVGNSDAMVYLYTDEAENIVKFNQFFDQNQIQYEYNYGQGEFVGTWGEREEAYGIYDRVIEGAVASGSIREESIRDLRKREDETIGDYRSRAAKTISERTGEEVEFGSRSQKYSIDGTYNFISGLKSAGLSEQQIQKALVDKLGLSPSAAQSLMSSQATQPTSVAKSNNDLVREALSNIQSGMPEQDVKNAISSQVQDPNLIDQLYNIAAKLNVQPSTDNTLSKTKIDNALRVPEKNKPGFFSRAWDWISNLSKHLDNPNRYITRLQEQVEKEYGVSTGRIPLGRIFEKNATGRAVSKVQDFLKSVVGGLSKTDIANLEKYIFVKRIIDRNQQDIINASLAPDAAPRTTGNITLQDAVNVMDQMKSDLGADVIADFERRSSEFQRIADENLQLLVASGIISEEVYRNIKNQNDFYAPFNVTQTLVGNGRDKSSAPLVANSVVKKIQGISQKNGEYTIDDINTLQDAMNNGTITKDEFYESANSVLDNMLANGVITDEEHSIELGKLSDSGFSISNIIDRMAAIVYDSVVIANKNDMMLRLDALADIDTDGLFVRRVQGANALSLASVKTEEGFAPVSYKKNGAVQFLAIDEKAANTINGLDKKELSAWGKGVNFINSAFRTAIITLSPSFQVANFVIDFFRNAAFNKYGLFAGKNIGDRMANVVLYVPQYIEALVTSAAGNLGAKNELWDNFMKSDSFSQGLYDDPFTDAGGQRSLSLRTASGFSKAKNSVSKIINYIGTVAEQSHKIVSIQRGMDTEAGIRLGISRLKNIITDAKTPEQLADAIDRVAYETQNLAGSPNFAATSSTMKSLSVVFQFISARVKGEMTDWRRLSNTFTGTGEGVKMTKAERAQMMAQIGSLFSFITLAAIGNHEDDDEEKGFYSMGAYDRDNNINIPMGKFTLDGKEYTEYVKIPVRGIPQNINVISNAYLKWRKGQDPDALKNGLLKAMGSSSPLTISGDNPQEIMESGLGNTTPVFKFYLEKATNRDFFMHRDLIPERYGVHKVKDYLEEGILRPDHQIFSRKKTPDWAKKMSTWLKDDWDISVTPIALDHFENTFFGNITDVFKKNPIQRRFTRSGSTNPVWKDR